MNTNGHESDCIREDSCSFVHDGILSYLCSSVFICGYNNSAIKLGVRLRQVGTSLAGSCRMLHIPLDDPVNLERSCGEPAE
jgi:hypothetical protein